MSRREDAEVFGIAVKAHSPRQFEIELRLRAEVMRI
jgi:hypothetical protein